MLSATHLIGFGAGGIGGLGRYPVDYSCRFNDDDSSYLTFTPDAGNTKKWTVSVWFKRGVVAAKQQIIWSAGDWDSAYTALEISANNYLILDDYSSGAYKIKLRPSRVFRDPHAWYHIVVKYDSTPSTPGSSNCAIYINGVQETSFVGSGESYPSQNEDSVWNAAVAHRVGTVIAGSGDRYFDGYVAEFVHIEDDNLAATSFGEFDDNGVWRPINVSGLTYNTNAFYLDFSSSTIGTGGAGQLGSDVSGNDNHFDSDAGGLAVNDRVVDTPTNNLATLTPLWTGAALSNGNLKAVATGNAYQWAISSIAIPESGKWVCEFQSSNIDGSSKYGYVGICQMGNHGAKNSNNYIYGLNLGNGDIIKNSETVGDGVDAPMTSLIRLEYNASTDALEFFDDGVSVHSATPALSGHSTLHFFCAPYGSDADITATFTGLTGTPTTDFITLSTTNLPVPAIVDPSIYVQAHNYDGTGGAHTETLSNHNSLLGTLDMLLLKNFATTDSPRIFAAHTEMGNQKAILLDQAAIMEPNVNGVTSIGVANTFGLGSGAGGFNDDGESFSSYCFHVAKTAEATNEVGSIDSKVIINDSAGWSMGTWEGTEANATIGHGLTTKPNFLLISSLDDSGENVRMGFTSLGWTKNIGFTGAIPVPYTDATVFQDLEPTASVFYVGSNAAANDSGGTMFFFAAYDVPGFSTWGHLYAGTAVPDGPLALYGFNAEFVWLMRTPGATVWTAIDGIRDPYNQTESGVRINDNVAGATNLVDMDILSNGLKIKMNGGDVNDAGNFYIMACAKNPFGGFGGTFGSVDGVTPATAR